jgi:hypothetical protein
VDTHQLLLLVGLIRDGCTECGGALYVAGSEMQGHCLGMVVKCAACSKSTIWNGSKQHQDKSFAVNRDIVRSWFVTGGERGKYQQFSKAMRCGTYNPTSFDQTVDLLIPIILEMEDKCYKENIDQVNETKECILGFDCSHSRSQRATGAAPFATTTFICHLEGANYGKILFQSHLSKHQMQESGLKGTESKDKLTTDAGLTLMAEVVKCITHGVCDGSSSGNNSWKSIVQKTHPDAKLSNCSWHKTKHIGKDFKVQILDKKTMLQPGDAKVGNQKYKLAYPEITDMGITSDKVKNHFIHSQKSCGGNAQEMEDEF